MNLPVLKEAISTALPTVSTTTSARVGASVVVASSGILNKANKTVMHRFKRMSLILIQQNPHSIRVIH